MSNLNSYYLMSCIGLGHNDLCSLNVVITIPAVVGQAPAIISKNPKYVVKLLDFGRSTLEPRPAPVLSALAALKVAQTVSLHQRSVPSWEEKDQERKERAKDLIFPGTRPFAAPEIMRAWTLSDAGGVNTAKSDDEEEDEDISDEDDLISEHPDTAMDEDEHFMASSMSVPIPPAPLPLPLSTPAYARDDDMAQQQQQQLTALHVGRSPLRSRMPILSFSDNSSTSGASSSAYAPLPADIPSNSRSRIVPTRGRTGPSVETAHAYPSPTSSPSRSPPSLPSEHPFALDDAADVVASETRHSSRHSRRDRSSQSRSRWESRSNTNTTPSTPLHTHSHLQPPPVAALYTIPPGKSKAEIKARRKARHKREIEAIHVDDPHPPSTILGDTYSLGVLALCLERDVLVDVPPHVQMREKWRPLDLSDPENNKHAVPIPLSQRGIAFFDGRFSTAGPSASTSTIRTAAPLYQRGGKAPVAPPPPSSLIERYLRPVRQRVKCSKDDALDVDAIKELEREWALHSTSTATIIAPVPVAFVASAVVANNTYSSHPHTRRPSPEMDFLMDDGGG